MGKQRIHYWDNAKAALILLVVMGHFLLPLENKMGGGTGYLLVDISFPHASVCVCVRRFFKRLCRERWKGISFDWVHYLVFDIHGSTLGASILL